MVDWVPLLTFHDIDDGPSVVSFPLDAFRLGMRSLAEEGYRTVSLAQMVESIRKAESFPDRTIGITFDDGYHGVYEKAFPVLKEHGMTATVFLAIGDRTDGGFRERLRSMGGRRMLNWSEIREMHRDGIDVGAHSLTHQDLTRLPWKRLHEEICAPKSRMEDILGSAVTAFAYPFGYHNRSIREIVQAHYSCACSARLGVVRSTSDPFALERVDMYYFRSERLFRMLFTRRFPLYVSLRGIARQARSLLRTGRWL